MLLDNALLGNILLQSYDGRDVNVSSHVKEKALRMQQNLGLRHFSVECQAHVTLSSEQAGVIRNEVDCLC